MTTDLESIFAFAREDYAAFLALCAPELDMTEDHRRLCGLLMDIARFRRRRVIVSCFPGFGKSTLSAKYFVPWVLGNDPEMKIIQTANSDDLVYDFSQFQRMVMKGAEYRAIFSGLELNAGVDAAKKWKTMRGGVVQSFGIQAGILGVRSNLIIVDDPFANGASAKSPAMQERIYSIFRNTLLGRNSDPHKDAIVIIASRQAPGDLIGRLMAGADAAEWEIFSFPIVGMNPQADDFGKSRWPTRYNDEWVAKRRAAVGNEEWMTQYLCVPVLPSENSIRREMWKFVEPEHVPDGVRWYYGLDLAVTTRMQSDNSSVARLGRSVRGDWYIDGGMYGKWKWPETKQHTMNFVGHRPAPLGVEAVGGFRAASAELRESLAGRLQVIDVPCAVDKMAGAWQWLSLLSQGKLFLVNNAYSKAWFDELLYEAESFGSTLAHDDVLDSVTVAYTLATRYGNCGSGFNGVVD